MSTRGEIQQRVAELLRKHQVQGPPVPVRNIAVAEGLQVLESSSQGDISGALIRASGVTVIAVNASHHINRQRFTIGHEMAHHFLQHKGERDHLDWNFTVMRRDTRSSEATDAQEIEANFFAANLLMPKEFVRRDVAQLARFNGEAALDEAAIRSLARKYQVSESAMTFRLVSLGLIDPSGV
jgi:Zn-dependent peptidase ImmA (M78 family)